MVEAPGVGRRVPCRGGVGEAAARTIAAVTTTADGSTLPGSPERVFVNPRVFDPLGRRRSADRAQPRGHPRRGRSGGAAAAGLAVGGIRRLGRAGGQPGAGARARAQVLAEVRAGSVPSPPAEARGVRGGERRPRRGVRVGVARRRLIARTRGEATCSASGAPSTSRAASDRPSAPRSAPPARRSRARGAASSSGSPAEHPRGSGRLGRCVTPGRRPPAGRSTGVPPGWCSSPQPPRSSALGGALLPWDWVPGGTLRPAPPDRRPHVEPAAAAESYNGFVRPLS